MYWAQVFNCPPPAFPSGLSDIFDSDGGELFRRSFASGDTLTTIGLVLIGKLFAVFGSVSESGPSESLVSPVNGRCRIIDATYIAKQSI